MKVTYDQEVDVLPILLSESPIHGSDEDKPGVLIDHDREGNLDSLVKTRFEEVPAI